MDINDNANNFQKELPRKKKYTGKPSYYVGIGASAGGLGTSALF